MAHHDKQVLIGRVSSIYRMSFHTCTNVFAASDRERNDRDRDSQGLGFA